MKKQLSPLVGDAQTVALVGLSKNAGKTTALARLVEEFRGECLGITSIGLDGEDIDLVTGTHKPRVLVPEGTLFATVQGLLPQCEATLEVVGLTGVTTPLGAVGVFRARSGGRICLAGPSTVGQVLPLADQFRSLGATRVLLDGAAGRRSLAGAEPDTAVLLCAGASLEGGLAHLVEETAYAAMVIGTAAVPHSDLRTALELETRAFALFSQQGDELPMPMEGDDPAFGKLPPDCVLWVGGGVTSSLLRRLSGRRILVVTPDATHILADRKTGQAFLDRGGQWAVRSPLKLVGVCANPWSAYGGHVEQTALLRQLRNAVPVPVVDVKGE